MMFQTVITWVRRVFGLIKKDDIKRIVGVEAAVSEEMEKAIELWDKMYAGAAPWLGRDVKSLNLPCCISAEIARLVTIEMKTEAAGSKRGEYINEQYQNAIEDLRQYVEYGCAKGGLVLKPYVNGDKIIVDYIQADKFVPTAFNSSGDIIGAAFIDSIKRGKAVFTRMEYHNLAEDGYTIKNMAYRSEGGYDLGRQIELSTVPEWAELAPEATIQNIDMPLFAYFKVPQANTVDATSPLGVSVFSRAVGLIEEADRQYSRLLWEFESGERAMYVDDTAFKKDKNGNQILPHKRLYRLLPGTSERGDLFKDWTPALREQNIINGLDSILVKIEDACGLARGTFSNPQSEARTATELKILRQRSYATVTDTQKALQKALERLIAIMDIWCTLYKLAPKGKVETSFEFDDSIVTDRDAEFMEKQQLVTLGIMQRWEMRAWYLGETEEQAKAMLAIEPEPPEE